MSQERVDVLIVVALREELEAVLAEGPAWREQRDRSGATYYTNGWKSAGGQTLKLAAAWLGGFGQQAATSRSRRLVDDLDPICLAMCGVCGGRSGRVKLGDVIVADEVIELEETGAMVRSYALDLAWTTSAAALASDPGWREALSRSRPPSLQAQTSWLLRALLDQAKDGVAPAYREDRKERCPDWSRAVKELLTMGDVNIDAKGNLALLPRGRERAIEDMVVNPDGPFVDPPLKVHLGTLATATNVVKNAAFFERWNLGVRRPLGVDMESSALASVALHTGRRWLVVRGVSSLVDEEKGERLFGFAARAAASFLITFLHRYFEVSSRGESPSDRPEEIVEPIVLEKLSINGFKNIPELSLDFTADSKLGGRWTCLAGINGSGKTSILQAIVLALLGEKLAEQLGSVRLARMVRHGPEASGLAEITVTVRTGSEVQTLSLPLCAEGIDSARLDGYAGVKEMRALWERRARRGILVAYGASRNLSEYLDNRHESLHPEVQRQMTLFDPLARVARADRLLAEDPAAAPVIGTLRRLLATILKDLPIAVAAGDGALRFEMDGAVLPVSSLPDGFRSSIAWLGDLCAAWHEKARPEDVGDGDPRNIHGIVLVDEIDLHLHPGLQRVLVPRLREAMPRVQWIVTTHSPLVLASFDRREIKMLDSSRPGGVRELDRDILGFTTDQIYEWLMGTRPRGVVLEEMLAEAEAGAADPARREELAVLVATAPDFNEEEAKQRVAWRRGLLDRLKSGSGPGGRVTQGAGTGGRVGGGADSGDEPKG